MLVAIRRFIFVVSWMPRERVVSENNRGGAMNLSRVLFILIAVSCGGCGQQETVDNSGVEAMGRGDFRTAIEEFTVLIEKQPEMAGAYAYRGMAYFSLAREDPANIDKAIADFSKAIELKPKEEELARLLGHRASAYYSQKKYQLAIDDLSTSIKLDPYAEGNYLGRADCRYELKDYEGSVEDLRKAAQIAPQNVLVLAKLAERSADIGLYTESMKACEQFLKLAPPTELHLGHRIRANIFYRQGKYQEAINEFTKSLESFPNDLNSCHFRGMSRIAVKDYEGAKNDFSKSIEMNELSGKPELRKTLVEAYHQRAYCHEQMGDREQAIADFTSALEIDPKMVLLYIHRGRVMIEDGRPEDAVENFTELIKQAPSAKAYRARSAAHKAAGNAKAASEDEAQAARRENPKKGS